MSDAVDAEPSVSPTDNPEDMSTSDYEQHVQAYGEEMLKEYREREAAWTEEHRASGIDILLSLKSLFLFHCILECCLRKQQHI